MLDSAPALQQLGQEQSRLHTWDLELRRQEAQLHADRAEWRRSERALRRRTAALQRNCETLSAFIDDLNVPDATRRILRLRHLDCMTLQQISQSLETEGVYYGIRHIDRLLRRGEKAMAQCWTERKEKKP